MAAGTGNGQSIFAVIVSVVLGLAAAGGAAGAIVSANAPSDSTAVEEGPAETLDPAVVLNYGG